MGKLKKENRFMTTIGILSDTHLRSPDERFISQCINAFHHCEVIIHAGDLTDASILTVFKEKEVYAVHGNMCNPKTSAVLEREKRVRLGGYTIGITHGAGSRHNIEERVFEIFPDVDCIVFGHTHMPVCHYYGNILMINPGSFQGTGTYGAAGSYALLEMKDTRLHGSLHSL